MSLRRIILSYENGDNNIMTDENNAIPKVIHYCWFGGNPIPEKDQACIDSWKKYCPDYKICRWDESNYDITKNQYMYEAYKAKKWGFVPDYARLDIIYNHGGIYLDTDVELIKNLDDLLENEAFVGYEDDEHINFGLGFGAVKNHEGIKQIMSNYDEIRFINDDGTLNTVASPTVNSDFFKQKGAVLNGELQTFLGITMYPVDYFCPMDFNTGLLKLTENTYSIHRFHMSWVDPDLKRWHTFKFGLNRKVGPKAAKMIILIIWPPVRLILHIRKYGFTRIAKIISDKIGFS